MRRIYAAVLVLVAASGIAGCKPSAQTTNYKGFAICTGVQTVTVKRGQTLTGLIEALVATPPKESLKSSKNLTLLAKAITADGIKATKPSRHVIEVYPTYEGVQAAQLSANTSVALPKECHRIRQA